MKLLGRFFYSIRMKLLGTRVPGQGFRVEDSGMRASRGLRGVGCKDHPCIIAYVTQVWFMHSLRL